MLTRAQKEEQVVSLRDKFQRATSVIVADYRGLSVASVSALRRTLWDKGSGDFEYCVTKNSLLRRACEGLPAAGIAAHFRGPSAVALTYGDPVRLAKLLVDYAKQNERFEIKGGVVEGRAVGRGEIATLATLPSLLELRGRLVGLLVAPASQLVRVLAAPGGQLARLAEARRAQLEEGAGA